MLGSHPRRTVYRWFELYAECQYALSSAAQRSIAIQTSSYPHVGSRQFGTNVFRRSRQTKNLNSQAFSIASLGTRMAPILIEEVADQPEKPTHLELTPIEATLRRLLLDVAAYIDRNPIHLNGESMVELPPDLARQPLILRFTGGWVRDKLLGVGSHDIDVAINKMTGFQFGLRMKEYLEIPGNPEKYGLDGVAQTEKQDQTAYSSGKSNVVGGLHKIEANPEKSKHLETVATRILGLDIDLVNLRKETYSDDSRNPQIEFGSPEEDAMRRDATINAMFYNINNEAIEDFTDRGHEDLRNQLLRTPLEPYQTFKDDPLRVLRLIRFASRLGYRIDPAALNAMQDAEIQEALKRKISRERVGTELEKALRGPDPYEAMRLVFELNLYQVMFFDPTATTHIDPEVDGWQVFLKFLKEVSESGSILSEVLLENEDEIFRAWIVAAIVPYRNAPAPEPPKPGRKPSAPIIAGVVREGIKTTNKILEVVLAAVKHQEEIAELVDQVYERKRRPQKTINGDDATARDVLGMAIRRWDWGWRSQVIYSMLAEVANGRQEITTIEKKYTVFVQHLADLDILNAYTFKPFLDGKTLAKALDMKPGPWMKEALEVVMAYQLLHSNDLNADEAIAEVTNARYHAQNVQNGGELTASLLRHFLKLTIRPLFSKAKPDSITDMGRRNLKTELPKRLTMQVEDESITKPWKSNSLVLDQLRWCIEAADKTLLAEVWPLLMPPVLTLMDDWEVKYKQIGANLIQTLMSKTSPDLLDRSGLGQVLAEALMPCLTYIPTITPEEESVPLLNAVYPALLALARVQFHEEVRGISRKNIHKIRDTKQEYTKFLDAIMRKGILYSYTHCSTLPGFVSTLLVHLRSVVEEMGINSVKHLKYILPMLSEVLSHPLIGTKTSALPESDEVTDMLQTAAKALQAVLENGSPRMVHHRGEILKGLALCWIKLSARTDTAAEAVKVELQKTTQMLGLAVASHVNFRTECMELVEVDERLTHLFDLPKGSSHSGAP